MHEIISTLQDLWQSLHQHGFSSLGPMSYVVIALLVATEGPITTLVGAAGAAAGYLDIRLVFIATAVGNIVGDALWYSVGYFSKAERLHKFTARFGLRRRHVEQLTAEMRTHATKAILVSKITFGLIVPTLVAAGLSRAPLRRWLPAVLVAETLWTILLVTLGFHGAGAISRIEDGFRVVGVVTAAVAVTVVVLYVKRKRQASGSTIASSPKSPLSVQSLGKKSPSRNTQPARRTLAHPGSAQHRMAEQHRRPLRTMHTSTHPREEILEKA